MRDLGKPRRILIFLVLTGIAILLPACGQRKAGETVEGKVLDTAGKPVAEVRVFNTGDGPEAVETRTDGSGRFCLEGLSSGQIHVFAEKAEYRFSGIRATTGATDVVIRLAHQSEPAPLRPIATKCMPLDRQQEIARKMLEKLWAEDLRGKQYYWVTMAMSRIDPELALRWSPESGNECTGFIQASMAEKIADDDLDEAFSLIGRNGPDRLNMIVKLAHRYRVSDPAKAMRCAEELVVGARAFDLPWRAGYLAEAGSIVIQLGNKDAGWKLLDEAGEMAAKLGTEHGHAGARGMVAKAMAASDVKRALDLIKPITPKNNPDRFLADVAEACCLKDLDRALEIAAKIGSRDADCVRLRIAYRLAPTRPADALRVVDTIRTDPEIDSGKVRKAMVLGWVGVAVAPHDKAMACSLIDQAFALLMSPDTSDSSTYGGRSSRAAFLAIQAQRIGYPDMESIVDRVLACRPTRKSDSSAARVMQTLESEIFTAAFLGLVDPQAARHILDSIEPQYREIGSGSSTDDRVIWIKAWLLADAKRGQTLFDEAFAAIKDKPGTDDEFYELADVPELLAVPLLEKSQHIVANHPDFRPPSEED
jgi:hypothetical protein